MAECDGGLPMGGVSDEAEMRETSSKNGVDRLIESVGTWNKQPVNIAVINPFITICACYILYPQKNHH